MTSSCCFSTTLFLTCTLLGLLHSVFPYGLNAQATADSVPEKSQLKCPHNLGDCNELPRVGRREKIAELRRGINCAEKKSHRPSICKVFLGRKREVEKMDVPNRETLEHRAKRFCKFLLPICRGPAGKMKYLTDKRRKTETVPEAGKTTNKSEDQPSQENCSIYDVWCLSGRKRTLSQRICEDSVSSQTPICRWSFGK